ncbi:hypothetical protein OG216_28380 [Streptomycetaceae bacterium NBC_01309]
MHNLTGRTELSITARTAPWGYQAGGTAAKLYVRTGSGMAWYDSGAVTVGPNGARLTLELTQVANIHDIREIGVAFAPAAGANGRSAVYVDELTVR